MLYLLIIVLAAVLAALMRVQRKKQHVWQKEYQRLLAAAAPAPVPPETVGDGAIPFRLIEQRDGEDGEVGEAWLPEEASETGGGGTPHPWGAAYPHRSTAGFEAQAGMPPAEEAPAAGATISAQEVLRNLRNSRKAAPPPPPVAAAEEGDYGVRILSNRTGAEDLQLITREEATRFQTAAETHPAEPPRYADQAAGAEIIAIEEIRHHLSRKQQALAVQTEAGHQAQRLPENTLREIAEGEVWDNLNHLRIPAALRRPRAQTVQSNRLPPGEMPGTVPRPSGRGAEISAAASLPEAAPAADFPAVSVPAPVMPQPQVASPLVPAVAAAPPQYAPHAHAAAAAEVRPPAAPLPEKTATVPAWADAPAAETWPPAEAAADEPDHSAVMDWISREADDVFSQPETAPHALPPLNLLLPPEHNPQAVQSAEELLENSITIEEKLAEYRVKVKVLDAYAGPVITRYEIEPDTGVRGSSVINLEKDLARSLGVAAIRVVETIPGKTCMGLELPNPQRQMIRLREIFNSPAFSGSPSKLTLALGQDITGEPVVADLAKAPHLLVAGTTGSGKSVGVNSMILSMLYKASPDEVRMIMIDPKMLELSIYEGIPHLLAPVVTDMKLAANALTWCVNEMEKRYRLMSHLGVRNLAGYNQKIAEAAAAGRKTANPFSFTPADAEPLEKLPFIVVVVDEFADLMMVAGKQIEQLIARLAQKARAAGIHLILATQRPSVDVITGLIKANIPTRIAFQVSTKIDSRTILDQMGAENLLGQGDMLFLPPGTGYPQRVHGAFVADSEVHAVVEYLKQFGEPDYVEDILNPIQAELGLEGGSTNGGGSERDPLFDKAVDIVTKSRKTSISYLQRQLRTGYNKAATLMEQMETEGIVSAPDHTGKRTILTHKQE